MDWKIGVQCWTFHKFTFVEAVEKAAATGADYLEIFPGQVFSKDTGEMKVNHEMPAEQRQIVRDVVAQAGLAMQAYGVVGLPNDQAECRRVFEFAREMGIAVIVSEPPEEALDLVDRLAQEFEIRVAIHNHPAPSHYWHPDTVAAACAGRSRWLGVCADTGHWPRSGVDALTAVRQLANRIISFHFKDLNAFGQMEAHDVVWGTGVCPVADILAELKTQNWTGWFSAEFEYNWDDSVDDVRQCIDWFRGQV